MRHARSRDEDYDEAAVLSFAKEARAALDKVIAKKEKVQRRHLRLVRRSASTPRVTL
jgi:hypothetical protein